MEFHGRPLFPSHKRKRAPSNKEVATERVLTSFSWKKKKKKILSEGGKEEDSITWGGFFPATDRQQPGNFPHHNGKLELPPH